MRPYKFIISGGGTGGHIFPAIAIANEIKVRYPDAEILFVGALGRMEMEKIPAAGYKIIGLNISGIQRSFTLKNFLVPFRLLGALNPFLFYLFNRFSSSSLYFSRSKRYLLFQ